MLLLAVVLIVIGLIFGGNDMKSIEYVASGTSHTRVLNNSVFENYEIVDMINRYFSDMNDKNNHKFSLLYNAYTEKNFGEKFLEHYRKSLYAIHADSGGLQIVTRGFKITDELKDEIYKTQAKSSDVAMCFDDIPIGIIGEKSERMDVANRYFDKDRLEEFARRTGKNIRRQIEIFLDEKSKAKPYLIAQGNCYDTYMKWVEYILDEIPKSHRKYIGGLAMGAAALGTGSLEDIERAAYATKLPLEMEEPHLHILGVGSIQRLLPYLMFAKNGYYPDNIHISYDSTTHTCGLSMGTYFLNKTIQINRDFANPIYRTIYNDVNSKYDLESKGISLKEFHESINTNSSYYMSEDKIDKRQLEVYYNVIFSYLLSSISNFTHQVDRALKEKNYIFELAEKNKIGREISALSNITDIDTFIKWKNEIQNDIKSRKVMNEKPNTLEDFFQ